MSKVNADDDDECCGGSVIKKCRKKVTVRKCNGKSHFGYDFNSILSFLIFHTN